GFNNNFVNRAITSGGTILVYAFRDLNVNNPIASAVSGWLDLRSANGVTTGTGNLNLAAPLSVGNGGLTLMSGINGTRPDWTATTTNLMQTGATFGPVNIDGFNNFTLNRPITSSSFVTIRSFRDLNVSAGNNITTSVAGFLTLQAANGVTTGTGNLNILSNLSVGAGGLTLTSGINGTRPTWTADNTSLVRQQTTFGAIAIGGFENFIVNRILNSNAAVAFSSNNRVTLGSDVSSGGTGALTFTNSPVVVASGQSVILSSNNQAITFNAASTVNGTAGGAAETLTVNSGTATTTFSGAVNELNLTANAGTFSLGAAMGATTPMGNVSLTSTNAMTLPAITASTILARTTGAAADITLGANLTANATTGTSITLAAGRDLNNSGNRLLNTSGTARWLVYSGDAANATITKGGLTGAFNRYGCNFGGSCPTGVTIPAAGNGFVYTFRPTATLTSVSAANKVYDGLTTATVDTSAAFISGGLLPGDSPTPDYTLAKANFADKNVGTGKIVTLSDITDDMGYIYTTSITSDITPKALTVSGAVANNKVYDALTTATLSGVSLVGIVTGDIVNFNAGTTSASFADKNVGTGKAVTVSAIGITGADAGNYTVTSPTGLTANITPAALGMTGVTASNKVYDALTTAALNFGGATFSGLFGGDTVTFNSGAATGNFADKNVGTGKAVTVAGVTIGGADAGNYTFTQPTGLTADITPASMTVTGVTASNKVYDALTSATLSFASAMITGVLGSDAVIIDSGAASGVFA
ncbi:MAG: beta strand repeat-containing protein, partial [Alphaproteobacteria bacterium]